MFKVLRYTLKGSTGRIQVFGHVRYCYYKSLMLPKAVRPKRQAQKHLKESSCLCLSRYRGNSRSSSNTPPTETLDQQRWQLCVNSWLTGCANTLARAPRGVDSGDGMRDGAFDMYKPSRLPLERPHLPRPPTNQQLISSIRYKVCADGLSNPHPKPLRQLSHITTNSLCCFPWCSTAGMNCIYVWSLTAVEAYRVTYVT